MLRHAERDGLVYLAVTTADIPDYYEFTVLRADTLQGWSLAFSRSGGRRDGAWEISALREAYIRVIKRRRATYSRLMGAHQHSSDGFGWRPVDLADPLAAIAASAPAFGPFEDVVMVSELARWAQQYPPFRTA